MSTLLTHFAINKEGNLNQDNEKRRSMHEYASLGKAFCRHTSSIGCSYTTRVVTWQDVCEGFLIHYEKTY